MNEHTKGPWFVRDGANTKSVHNMVFEGDMCSIATVHGSVDCAVDWYAGASHLHSNASLIAAAPSMLKALESILNDCDHNSRIGHTARKAIAEARGKS